MQYQTTIHKNIYLEGIGLHSGCRGKLNLLPAAANTGIIISSIDSLGQIVENIVASWKSLQSSLLATTLKGKIKTVQTIEHLMATLNGLEIDNLLIQLDFQEVPIMDGSSQVFTEAILNAGLHKQESPRQYLQINKVIRVEQGDHWMQIEPAPRLEIDCTIDFPNYPSIGRQSYRWWHSPYSFWQNISLARTFGFLDQIEAHKEKGLIKGGSKENAIIVDKQKIINPESLHFPDDFVRHKILDILGDLYLAGGPILGKVKAYKSGHQLHHQLLYKIFSEKENYTWISGLALAQNYRISRAANKVMYPN